MKEFHYLHLYNQFFSLLVVGQVDGEKMVAISRAHVAQINLTVNVCTPAANTWDRGWGDDHAWLVTSCLLIPGRRPSRVYDCVFIYPMRGR